MVSQHTVQVPTGWSVQVS